MNILYCGDRNIVDGVLISTLSLLSHTAEPLHIYILTATVSTSEKTYRAIPNSFARFLEHRVKQERPENRVTLFDITDRFAAEPPYANRDTRFTPLCMLRLYADTIDALPDTLLYLDNDVVCCGDFSDLYRTDLADCELGGVLDHYGKWFFRHHPFKADYFNSGVLLLNMRRIRETKLFARCRAMCAEKRMFMPDQSALYHLTAAKKEFPRRYNEQRRLRGDTVFRHFTTSFRFFPWFHAVSVKPWQIEKVHRVLKTAVYDELLTDYQALKTTYEEEQT